MYTQVNYCSSSIVISLISSIKKYSEQVWYVLIYSIAIDSAHMIQNTPDQRGLKCSLLVYNKRVLQKTEFFERYKFADLSMNIWEVIFINY